MSEHWLALARRLQAIAATGLHFTDGIYDRERYEEINVIATQMLSELASVPVRKLEGLLHSGEEGYATPRIDVRGAVLNNGRVLLIREAADGLWTLPGGYAEVGLSAAENVVKEVREEACLDVRATRLYAVRHKVKHGYRPDVRDFYKFFFLCEASADQQPDAGAEALDVGYFAPDALPVLSTGRTIAADIHAAMNAASNPSMPVLFD